MRVDVERFMSSARGQWLSIFSSLGVVVPEPPGKHGPCPICKNGEDRFRLDKDVSDGSWLCNQCTPQAGNGLNLVIRALGINFRDAVSKISEIIGTMPEKKECDNKESEYDRRQALNRLWTSSKKLTGSDPVSKYLHSRGLVMEPNFTRYCPECFESETKTTIPAMVAQFLGHDGKPLTIHRTYLNGTGKAQIKSPKKLMPGTGTLAGGSIRLFPPEENTIGVAEGIETAIAARQLFSIPTWAVVSSTLMQSFIPPDVIRKVVIFADNDDNFTGQEAAYILAKRLFKSGLVVDVELPEIGKDFNDYLLKTRGN